GNIQVIDRAISVQVLSSKILRRENAAASVQVEERVRIQMLPLAAEAQAVVSHGPIQSLAELNAIELGTLRNSEISTVLYAGEADFVPHRKPSGIGHRIVRAENRNGVQEPIAVEHEAIDHARRNDPCPCGQG